jgi:hypothetical protein
MIRFFASHRTAPNLLMLILIVMGLFGLPNIRRETFQQLPIDEIRVTVVYPGALWPARRSDRGHREHRRSAVRGDGRHRDSDGVPQGGR